MKVLAITNLFPNHREPGRGLFNQQQFIELSRLCELKVVAPLPWAPKFLASPFSDVVEKEVISGIETYHPRYFLTPKIGRSLYGRSYFWGIKKVATTIQQEFDFDCIFATWGYPDVYGAYLLAKRLQKPLVARVHGTDINILSRYMMQRSMMRKAFRYAGSVVANSRGLKERVTQIGIDANKVHVIGNGVDKALFKKLDQSQCQQELGLDPQKKHILFIGNLVAIKGVVYLIRALRQMDSNTELHIIGDGKLKVDLEGEAKDLGLKSRIHFHGRKEHNEITTWFNAVNVFCLPSLNEGCPNVVLESLACGTPVVASNVGGLPELIDSDQKGMLVEPQNDKALARSVESIIYREETSHNLSQDIGSWADNAKQLYELFEAEMK